MLDIDLCCLVGPSTRMHHFIKQHHRSHISHHEIVTDVVALLVNLAVHQLAHALFEKERAVEPVESMYRPEQGGRPLHEAHVDQQGVENTAMHALGLGGRSVRHDARDGEGLGRGRHVRCVCLRAACRWRLVASWFAATACFKHAGRARASRDFPPRLRLLKVRDAPGPVGI